MAYQKTLLLLLALVVVLHQVSAIEWGEINTDEIYDAYATLYNHQTLEPEKTEQLLQLIVDGMSEDNGADHLFRDRKFHEVYARATSYLDMCKEDEMGEYVNTRIYFDYYVEPMLEGVQNENNSPSIVKYLQNCIEKRTVDW